MHRLQFFTIITAALSSQPAFATVTEYTNKASWQNAVSNNYTTIRFSELPHHALVTTQYLYLGVMFTEASGDFIVQSQSAFPNDGWGLFGNSEGTVDMEFSQPMKCIGMEFPARLDIQLFSSGQLIYAGHGPGGFGGSGAGWFAGLVSDQQFDAARLLPVGGGDVNIDDLFFGPPIPAPGALSLFAAAGLLPRGRRRQ